MEARRMEALRKREGNIKGARQREVVSGRDRRRELGNSDTAADEEAT